MDFVLAGLGAAGGVRHGRGGQGSLHGRARNDARLVDAWKRPVKEYSNIKKSRSKNNFRLNVAQIDEVDKGNLVNEPSITCYMYCLLEAFSLVSFKETITAIKHEAILQEYGILV